MTTCRSDAAIVLDGDTHPTVAGVDDVGSQPYCVPTVPLQRTPPRGPWSYSFLAA